MVVGEFAEEADLVVVGGGPAGYAAAFRAAELGVKTTIVDTRDALGGVCLHDGCVPSKTLLHLADIVDAAAGAARFGLHFDPPRIDAAGVRAWLDKTVATLGRGLASRAKQLGIECIIGEAAFEDSRTIRISGNGLGRLKFRRALIATGTQPTNRHGLVYDGERIMSPEQASHLRSIPEKLAIIGSDYRAVEAAMIYCAFGSNVMLYLNGDDLCPGADRDLVKPLERVIKQRLAAVQVGDVQSVTNVSMGVQATTDEPCTFDAAIVCDGATPRIESLQLSKTKVKTGGDGSIEVDEQLRTTDPRIFAAGDVTGAPLAAHCALHQGRTAAEVIAGQNVAFDPGVVPQVVFTNPGLAWCGVTEEAAAEAGQPVEVSHLKWGASGRAVGMGAAGGVTKLIFDDDGVLIGAGICGREAAELIGEAALAIELGAHRDDLALTLHPHPTTSELISDVAGA